MGSILLAVWLNMADYSESFMEVTMKFVTIIFPLSAFSCLLILQLSIREVMAQSWLDCQNVPDGGSCIQHPFRCSRPKDPAIRFSCQSSKCWNGVCRFGKIYELFGSLSPGWVSDGSNSSDGSYGSDWGSSVTVGESSIDGTSVDSWGNSVFVGVDYLSWSSNSLDDWFTLDWGWDWYVVWGINVDWGWYIDSLGNVLEDFVWDIVWSFNWNWFVDYEGFLAYAGDWCVVGNGSLKSSWDSNVEVSKDWLDDGGVISSDVWASSVFDVLGYYWWWLVNGDGVWARYVGGGVWGWDTDGWSWDVDWSGSYSWGSSNDSSSWGGSDDSSSWGSSVSSVSKTDSWGSGDGGGWGSGNSGVSKTESWGSGKSGVSKTDSWGSSSDGGSWSSSVPSSFSFWYWSGHGGSAQHSEYALHWIHCVGFLCLRQH